jgi:hypothetical protein
MERHWIFGVSKKKYGKAVTCLNHPLRADAFWKIIGGGSLRRVETSDRRTIGEKCVHNV